MEKSPGATGATVHTMDRLPPPTLAGAAVTFTAAPLVCSTLHDNGEMGTVADSVTCTGRPEVTAASDVRLVLITGGTIRKQRAQKNPRHSTSKESTGTSGGGGTNSRRLGNSGKMFAPRERPVFGVDNAAAFPAASAQVKTRPTSPGVSTDVTV